MAEWTDRFVGERMAVDRDFSDRVAASDFSSQEWGTIMTAVELEIEDPEDPDAARVVADTSQLDQVMPAVEQMGQAMGGMGGPPGGGGGAGAGAGGGSGDDGGDGLLGSIKESIGLGGGGSGGSDRTEAAAALADEYATAFQKRLESEGKWERARSTAADADDETAADSAESAGTSEADTNDS